MLAVARHRRHACLIIARLAIACFAGLLSWSGTASAEPGAKSNPAAKAPAVATTTTRTVPTVAISPKKPAASPKAKPQANPVAAKPNGKQAPMTMALFLDRLMIAESSGRADAKNPRSTATGAYQFIESTFLDLIRRHFPEKAQKLTVVEQLKLRYDVAFSRKLAEIYTRENAAILVADGHKPTFTNLRLAFLLGPGGASRVLAMDPNAPVAPVLGRAVMVANPFMIGMTAGDLIAKAARDLSVSPTNTASARPGKLARRARRTGPRIRVRCNLRRPSCRRWLALKRRKLRAKSRRRVAKGSRRRRVASRQSRRRR